MMTQKFEPTVKYAEKTSGTEITSNSLENESSTRRTSTDRSAAFPEVKVESVETPVSSPRLSKRASKPGRPGKMHFLQLRLICVMVLNITNQSVCSLRAPRGGGSDEN